MANNPEFPDTFLSSIVKIQDLFDFPVPYQTHCPTVAQPFPDYPTTFPQSAHTLPIVQVHPSFCWTLPSLYQISLFPFSFFSLTKPQRCIFYPQSPLSIIPSFLNWSCHVPFPPMKQFPCLVILTKKNPPPSTHSPLHNTPFPLS